MKQYESRTYLCTEKIDSSANRKLRYDIANSGHRKLEEKNIQQQRLQRQYRANNFKL